MLFARRRGVRVVACLLAGLAAACEDLPNVPPSAAFIFSPVSPIAAGGTSVTFNASASSDSDGRIVSYLWDFGDGTPSQNDSSAVTSHIFPNRAETCVEVVYAVLLTVVDDRGDRGSASQNVAVTENCPR